MCVLSGPALSPLALRGTLSRKRERGKAGHLVAKLIAESCVSVPSPAGGRGWFEEPGEGKVGGYARLAVLQGRSLSTILTACNARRSHRVLGRLLTVIDPDAVKLWG